MTEALKLFESGKESWRRGREWLFSLIASGSGLLADRLDLSFMNRCIVAVFFIYFLPFLSEQDASVYLFKQERRMKEGEGSLKERMELPTGSTLGNLPEGWLLWRI